MVDNLTKECFAFPKRLFGLFALGDVVGDGADGDTFTIRAENRELLDENFPGEAVRIGDRAFFLDKGLGFCHLQFLVGNYFGGFLIQERIGGFADDGLGLHAVPVTEGLVDDQVPAVQVLDDDGARRGFDHGPEPFLAFP